jgi:hypothetical protein
MISSSVKTNSILAATSKRTLSQSFKMTSHQGKVRVIGPRELANSQVICFYWELCLVGQVKNGRLPIHDLHSILELCCRLRKRRKITKDTNHGRQSLNFQLGRHSFVTAHDLKPIVYIFPLKCDFMQFWRPLLKQSQKPFVRFDNQGRNVREKVSPCGGCRTLVRRAYE